MNNRTRIPDVVFAAGQEVPLFQTQQRTKDHIKSLLGRDRLALYRDITGDRQPDEDLDLEAITDFLLTWVEVQWYRTVAQEECPLGVLDRLVETLTKAVTAPQQKEKAIQGAGARTQKALALECLQRGLNTKQTLAQIRRYFPESRATTKTIAHYRWKFRKEGRL